MGNCLKKSKAATSSSKKTKTEIGRPDMDKPKKQRTWKSQSGPGNRSPQSDLPDLLLDGLELCANILELF